MDTTVVSGKTSITVPVEVMNSLIKGYSALEGSSVDAVKSKSSSHSDVAAFELACRKSQES